MKRKGKKINEKYINHDDKMIEINYTKSVGD